MSERDDLLIWWMTQADYEKMGEPHDLTKDVEQWEEFFTKHPYARYQIFDVSKSQIPDYVRRELISCSGRNGRGRLWVPDEIDLEQIDWDESKPATKYASNAGGIVFYRKALDIIKPYPGLITDLQLNIIEGH